MLKRIRVDQLAIGMFVHEFCGAWIDHPFWRSKFLVEGPDELRRVIEGQVKELWIDTARGADVVDPQAPTVPTAALEAAPEAAVAAGALRDSVDFGEEARRAAAICKRSKAAVTSLFAEARMGNAVDIEGCLPLVNEISDSVMRNAGAMISVVRLKTRDEYTYMHSVAVCALMVSLARQLDLDEQTTRDAGLAGLLHDIGKAYVPLPILNKPGKLTNDEFAVMRSHPERGHAMLAETELVPDSARDVCLHHHERIDGTGYPHRLKDNEISQLTKMAAVCDVYDALTSNRPYKAAWNPGEALRRMTLWKGHFDPLIFQAFVKTVGIYPAGSLVRLKSGRLAVVVDQDVQGLLTPKVRIFYSTKADERIPPVLLDLDPQLTQERIVACESAADWPFKDLDQLSARPGQ